MVPASEGPCLGNPLDKLDEEIAGGSVSPVSGIGSAINAGGALAAHPGRATVELPAYLFVQIAWFTAFGMQMVVFPYLLKNVLRESGTLLGVAQMALAAPSVVFILLGGVVAERAEGRVLLMLFHILAALPAVGLAFAIHYDGLMYWMMLIYAVAMGTVGAFMMPARDSILNAVVDRRRGAGSSMTLQQGVAFATLAQFAAQIAGLWLGGVANEQNAWTLLAVQGGVVGSGAIAALFLGKGNLTSERGRGATAVLHDIGDGMKAVKRDPVLLAMVTSMFGVGVFVIGAFLVILPIVNADVYHFNSGGLRNIFITFWAGAFCSSLALSRFKKLRRPGRLLLIAQFIGSAAILILVPGAPYWVFLTLVFGWGLAAGISIMMSRSIVQEAAPPALLARVLSIYQLGFMGGAPVGAALLGVIVDRAGPNLVILVPSIGMLSLIAYMFFFTPIWKMDAHKIAPLPDAPGK
jgi:MFS family permease